MLLTITVSPNDGTRMVTLPSIPFPKHSGANRVELKIHTLKAYNSIAIFASFSAMQVSRKQFQQCREAKKETNLRTLSELPSRMHISQRHQKQQGNLTKP